MKSILKKLIPALLTALILVGLVYEASVPIRNLYYQHLKSKGAEYAKGIKIGILGDSIWGNVKDETGIAAVVEQELGVEIINCAIGGTQAAYNRMPSDGRVDQSLMVITDQVVFGEAPYEDSSLDQSYLETDWQEMDYIFFSYGLNDYFAGIACQGDDLYDPDTYAGAIRTALTAWKEYAPQATFVLCAQNFTQLYSYGKVVDDSDTLDYGGGTGPEYVEVLRQIAGEYDDVIFIDIYEDVHIDMSNCTLMLGDGTHFTEYGREIYAKNVVKYLAKDLIAKYG
ncbi:MAG: SGNH/GDSL hydrolase family protein [Lachnospiraceae bacterium]|nr:SGNH/GDSL hydrolase family protein [Lachnospiraceae bacterium]